MSIEIPVKNGFPFNKKNWEVFGDSRGLWKNDWKSMEVNLIFLTWGYKFFQENTQCSKSIYWYRPIPDSTKQETIKDITNIACLQNSPLTVLQTEKESRGVRLEKRNSRI